MATALPGTGVPVSTDILTTLNGVAATTNEAIQRIKVSTGAPGTATDVSTTNPLPATTLGNGFISTTNSTAVALGIGAVFTGTAEDATEYADIRVTVFADQISAVDGFQIQQSSNGTSWDMSDVYNIPASTGKIFSIAAAAKFYRIVYTNGATAQTVFRLQTKLYKTYTKGSSVRPQDGRGNDNDVEEILSFSLGYNGTSWDRLRSSIANGLSVDVTRVLGSVAVTGTFFQATQPVSAASLPLPAGAAADATLTNHTLRLQAVTTLTTLSVANTAVTLTLPAVAAQFHYITRIEVVRVATAAVAGTAVLGYTSSNIPGAWARSTGNAIAAGGTVKDVDEVLENPVKSAVVNTATTIVAPAAGVAVQVRITAYYYTAA